MKKAIYSVILTVVLLVSSVRVYASNIENMSDSEIEKLGDAVLESVLSRDSTPIENYANCFTNETLEKLLNYINTNRIYGNIQSTVIDWVCTSYSSTEDSVMMINVKVENNGYNELYLFEFHINAEGKIYGYNVWAY